MAVDGHRLSGRHIRVGDRVEVQLVDESTGLVVARLDSEHAGRVADELVTAAGVAWLLNPPDAGAELRAGNAT